MAQRREGKDFKLDKSQPLLEIWKVTNAHLLEDTELAERALGLFQANIEGLLTPAQRKRLRERLYKLEEAIDFQRHHIPTGEFDIGTIRPEPRDWRFAKLSILLKHAERADLLDSTVLGDY